MLAPLTRITDATRTAATGSLSHRIELEGRKTSSASSPTPSMRCSRGSKRTSPSSSDSQPTPPTSCAPRSRSRRRFSTWPATIPTATAASSTIASVPSTPRDRTHRIAAPAQPRRPAVLRPEPVDLSLIAEEATETLLPLAETRGATIETSGDITPTIGSYALLLQMTTNLVHNAIVHNLPEHGAVQVSPATAPSVRAHGREHGRRLAPTGLDAHRTVPRGTERIRTDHAGVGLGLAIVKSITQAHDGTLTLTPRTAGGLAVTVQLPAAPQHMDAAVRPNKDIRSSNRPRTAPPGSRRSQPGAGRS